jgi:(p)ppGpp synthase/HD superfamily hydrolase
MNNYHDELVLRAIRIAEHAHRTREKGAHYRKAPAGEDRPAHFVHLTEVAWMLSDAGCSHEVVAAGYLHDIIEDCDYDGD